MGHLQELNNIAKSNGGTRTSDSAGFDKSVDYVYNKLKKYSNYFNVEVQQFTFQEFIEVEIPKLIIDGVSLSTKKISKK